jgi:phospholipid/cholesterol/gamma-HCH transport system permease protein
MTQLPTQSDPPVSPPGDSAVVRLLDRLGAPAVRGLAYLGGLANLTLDAGGWLYRSLILRRFRFGRAGLYSQLVRLGVRSVGVVMLVNLCIGLILALQMAPPLRNFGQTDQVATIIAIAVVRELGPLIVAIVMTGFAGAAIAAEVGTMVVGEEIEALNAHALNPVRFLVLPRMLATVVAMLVLTIIGEIVAIWGGYIMGTRFLDIPSGLYLSNTLDILDVQDFLTGLIKAGVFGVVIAAIACYNGLNVTGGAAGVGRATTYTVVYSITLIIFTDLIFTALFYKLGWT